MALPQRALKVELPILQYLRRAGDDSKPTQRVLLQSLIDSNRFLIQLTHRIEINPLMRKLEPTFKSLGIADEGQKRLFIRLSMLAYPAKRSALEATHQFQTDIYWQYFCGMTHFMTTFPSSVSQFHDFLDQTGNNRELRALNKLVAMSPGDSAESASSEEKFRLSDITDPMNPWVLTKELMPWNAIDELVAGKTRNDLFVKLAILISSAPGDGPWVADTLRSNPYWQLFCGFENFEPNPGVDFGDFSAFYKKFRISREFRAISEIAKTTLDSAIQLSKSSDPFAHAVNDLLVPKILNLDSRMYPLEANLLVQNATPEFWRDLIDAFRKRGWKTTWTDDVSANHSSDLAVIGGLENSGRLIFFSRCPTDPLEGLDASLRGLGGLWDLLKHDRVRDAYFSALQAYFGEYRFPREAYDAILKQLETILLKVPELEYRLWKINSSGPAVSITPEIPSYGRDLNPREFKKFVKGYLATLFHPAYAEKQPETFGHQLNDFSRQAELFELSNRTGNARLRRARASSFYQKLRSDCAIGEIARFLLHHFLLSRESKALLEYENPDVFIDFFRELRQNPGRILHHAGFPEMPFWASMIREAIPSTQELLARHDVFPVTTTKTRRGKEVARGRTQAVTYQFRPPTRLLHGIWRGIMWKECMGGDLEHIDQLMPERWANMVIRSTKFYFVEQAGKFLGTIQLTPIRVQGKRYWSLDSDWPHFFNRIGMAGKGKTQFITLFEAWLKKQKDVVVGNSTLVHRFPHELETLHQLSCYKKGKRIGQPSDVSFEDPIADDIIRASRDLGFGPEYRSLYGENILIDATVADANPLVLLKSRT